MKIKPIFLAFIFFGSGMAKADVLAETSCYSMVPPGKTSKPVRLTLRTYVDQDLKKEVGAFVQYNGSKETIPLVFAKYVSMDTDSPDLGNYEISRIEINEKKVTGEYIFSQSGAGNTQGKSVKYKSAKTGKAVTFQYVGDDPSCKINH